MENTAITLSYLQSLSTADLLLLADDYGIDIPEHLNRSFIISELYEISSEINEEFESSDLENSDSPVGASSNSLPETFNETQIDFILRTPVWAYVFWDISSADIHNIIEQKSFSRLLLKVYFWESDTSEKPIDSLELSITQSDRAQYILIPSGQKHFSIDLVVEHAGKKQEKIASSRRASIPQCVSEISLEMLDTPLSKIQELSGLEKLLKNHYESHRQSFS